MDCKFSKEVIGFEHNASLGKLEEFKKHIIDCEECRNIYGALIITEAYVKKDEKMDIDIAAVTISKIDTGLYKKRKLSFALISAAGRLKPVIKPAIGIVAVFTAVLLLQLAGFKLPDKLNPDVNNSGNLAVLRVEGRDVVDRDGSKIKLKGVVLTNNVWGNWDDNESPKLQSEGKYTLISPKVQDTWVLTDDDFKRIKDLGINCVVYGINYQLFDSSNPDRTANLKKLENHIERFNSMKVYTILALLSPPGLDVSKDVTEREKSGSIRIKSVFEDVNYYTQWLDMWKYLSGELKAVNGLAGYDVIYQPRIPCTKEGGTDIFKERLNSACEAIRNVDKTHILFIEEYRSREADAGETYYTSNTNEQKKDSGEQGIIWDPGFVKIDLPNVVYSFTFYEPYDFTYNGKGTFDSLEMENYVKKHVDFAQNTGNAPLIAYYCIARINSAGSRIAWLNTVHSIFRKYNISAVYSDYKASIGAYNDQENIFVSIYGQYITWNNEIKLENGTFHYMNGQVEQTAKDNGFDGLLSRYFYKNGVIEPVSLMDNGPVLDALKLFWQ